MLFFQAVMCSRLGGKAIMLGMVGNDDNGKAYIENFKVPYETGHKRRAVFCHVCPDGVKSNTKGERHNNVKNCVYRK